MSSFSIQYVLSFVFFRRKRSFFNNLINNPVGVTTKKKTIPITIGDNFFPRKIPNLNQILFKGVRNLELIIPRKKKINEIIKAHVLKLCSFNKGHNAIIKNIIEKTIPKLLFDPILISVFNLINRFLRFHIIFLDTSYLNWFFHSIPSKRFA